MAISFMFAFRRRLASGALALIVLQLALLLAAPMSCCLPGFGHMKLEVEKAAPEECPLHKSKDLGSRSEAQDSPCRMSCDSPHGPQFLLGAIGVLPAPDSTGVELVASALPDVAAITITARPSVPDAPPPRLL